MQKSNYRIPVGLALTLVIGLVGFKDTGIFVNSFNARLDNGVKLSFSPNNRAEIVGEGASKTTYLVESDGNKVYVPKDILLKVDNGINGYTVLENTALLSESGDIIRLLFLDEYLTFIENKGDLALVKTSDGLTGLVDKSKLNPDRIRNIVEGIAKEDLSLDNGTYTYNIKKGDTVEVVWFEKDYFIIFDQYQNKFNVDKDKISIFVDVEQVQEEVLKKATTLDKNDKVDKKDKEEIEKVSELPPSMVVEKIIKSAESKMGAPYVYADTGKAGYDCSGLIIASFKGNTDVKLPRSSYQMAEVGTYVTENQLQPGDLLFFNSGGSSRISHVALYIGDGTMIHASNSQNAVVKDKIDGYYFQNNFSHGRRVL